MAHRSVPRLLALPLLLAALAAGTRPAEARAPTASEEGCLDFIAQKLKDDHEEDLHPRIPIEEVKIVAYQKGESALDEWRPVAEIILDKEKKAPQARRDRATSALIDRMRLEEQRGTDFNVVRKVKNDVCNYLLKLILADDLVSRSYIYRLTEAFLPQKADWKPDDGKGAREKVYQALYKLLNRR